MRVLAIVHQRDAGPGVFAQALRARGIELHEWLVPKDAGPPQEPGDYDAVMAFGGAMHADQEHLHPWLADEKRLLAELLEMGMPLMGVCLGAQLLAAAAGAAPRRLSEPEIGWHDVELTPGAARDAVLGTLPPRFEAFQWHSYECPLPDGAVELARSHGCLQAYRVGDGAWGIQFHAEVTAADAEAWTADYRSDPDAVAIGLDPVALREQTAIRIAAWNELGTGVAGRFAEFARDS